MSSLSKETLLTLPVFGIAGNFAEHLSQAGEDADFANITTEEPNAPKGIFPIYLPNHTSFLSTFPLSHDAIKADFSSPINLHMEPEMCVLFDVAYTTDDKRIRELKPIAFSAFNDCSIRKPNAKKISEKKNWGESCTGIAEKWLPITSFEPNGCLDTFNIVSYIRRDNNVIDYGMDSQVCAYQFFYAKLTNWIKNTLNHQQNVGPLEPLSDYISELNFPKQIIVTLGATRYTEFGETGFLKPDDELAVFVYNRNEISEHKVRNHFESTPEKPFNAGCYLHQWVHNTA